MKQIEWNWYGKWVVEYFSCDCPWEAYDIWEDAYLAANPELQEIRESSIADNDCDAPGTTLDLITNHYHESLLIVENSPLLLLSLYLAYQPSRIFQCIWWNLYQLPIIQVFHKWKAFKL